MYITPPVKPKWKPDPIKLNGSFANAFSGTKNSPYLPLFIELH